MTQTNPPFDPKELHKRVRAAFAAVNPADIKATIYTDGSGHQDGFAGSGMVLLINGIAPIFAAAAETRSSTERGEFYALIRALAIMEEALKLNSRDKDMAAELKNFHIEWITDRESLALAVAINPDTGAPYYKRRTCLELWAAYEYFARFFQVHPLFVPRCTQMGAVKADQLASDSRQTLKNYFLLALEN